MTFQLSGEAADRPNQTIHAAGIFHDNARAIALACSAAREDELVVAAVTHDHAFRGIWTIPKGNLRDHVTDVDDGGWTLVFAPGTPLDTVEERCLKLARLAFARWETMRRWASRHA